MTDLDYNQKRCSECGIIYTVHINSDNIPVEEISKLKHQMLKQQGWSFSVNGDLCPKCAKMRFGKRAMLGLTEIRNSCDTIVCKDIISELVKAYRNIDEILSLIPPDKRISLEEKNEKPDFMKDAEAMRRIMDIAKRYHICGLTSDSAIQQIYDIVKERRH